MTIKSLYAFLDLPLFLASIVLGTPSSGQADKLIAKTPMKLAPDIRALLAEMPEKVRAAKKAEES